MVYLVSTTLLQVNTSEKLTFFQLALGNSKKVALVNKIMYLKERTLIWSMNVLIAYDEKCSRNKNALSQSKNVSAWSFSSMLIY